MGDKMFEFLDLMGVRHSVLDDHNLVSSLDNAVRLALRERFHTAVLDGGDS